MKQHCNKRAALIMLLFFTASCSPYQPTMRQSMENVLPSHFSLYGEEQERNNRWWESFNDPELNRLLDEAFTGSFSLKESWARLSQSKAAALQAGAALYPDLSITSDGSSTRQRSENDSGSKQTATVNSYSLGVAGSYELDLWGRVRSSREAERLEATASREDVNAAAMTLAAEVTEHWVSIAGLREETALLKNQLETSRTYLELVELRFSKSMASLLDVYQQKESVAQLKAAIPPLEAQEQLLLHELALLLGKLPKSELAIKRNMLPEIGDIPEVGIPADLLAQRPDVMAAGLRLQAADWQISTARADRLPAIRLTGSAAYDSSTIDSIFDNWLLNLAGSLTGPVFDGKFRVAEVQRTRAVAEERLASYQRIVMRAVKEVEDALVSEMKKREEIDAVSTQLSLARMALDEARQRYSKGLNDYLPVLTELQSVQQLELDLVRAQSELLISRIALYRSLGGGWTDAPETFSPPTNLAQIITR